MVLCTSVVGIAQVQIDPAPRRRVGRWTESTSEPTRLRLDLPSPSKVRFFADGAQIERCVAVSIEAGIFEVELRGFSEGLDLAKLHVSADDALLLSVDVVNTTPTAPLKPESEICTAGALMGIEAALRFLDGIKPPMQGRFAPDAYWKAHRHLESLRAGLEDQRDRLQNTSQRKKQLTPQTAKEELSHGMSPSLVLRLRKPAPGTCQVRIWTEVSEATWRSEYELRVDGAEVSIERNADIYHQFGGALTAETIELWSERPKTDVLHFRPGPWVVCSERPYEEQSAKLYANLHNPKEATKQPEPLEGFVPSIYRNLPMPIPQKVIEVLGPHHFEPDVPTMVRIPAPSFEAEWTYLIRPVIDPRAHAIVQLSPKDAEAFDGGQVNLFLQGIFSEASIQAPCRKDQPWTFEVGPLCTVLAQRQVEVTLDSDRMIHRGDHHRVLVQLCIESSLPGPSIVMVEDQLPLCSDPRLRIRYKGANYDGAGPVDATYASTSGLVRLTVPMKRQDKKVVRFAYEIESPRDYRLIQSLVS